MASFGKHFIQQDKPFYLKNSLIEKAEPFKNCFCNALSSRPMPTQEASHHMLAESTTIIQYKKIFNYLTYFYCIIKFRNGFCSLELKFLLQFCN